MGMAHAALRDGLVAGYGGVYYGGYGGFGGGGLGGFGGGGYGGGGYPEWLAVVTPAGADTVAADTVAADIRAPMGRAGQA
jgi:hypothetical protein